jgi:hypothetical protein
MIGWTLGFILEASSLVNLFEISKAYLERTVYYKGKTGEY